MNFGCMQVIKALQDKGHKIILNTYRADCNDGTLENALEYLNGNVRYEIQPIHEYTPNKITPPRWDIKKAIEDNELFIDDIANGIPLKKAAMVRGDMVDWDAVREQLINHEIL